MDYWCIHLPGLALFLASGAFNLIGDGIRDILDRNQLTEEESMLLEIKNLSVEFRGIRGTVRR